MTEEWEQYAHEQEQLSVLQQSFNDSFAKLSSQKVLVNARHERLMGLLNPSVIATPRLEARDQDSEIEDDELISSPFHTNNPPTDVSSVEGSECIESDKHLQALHDRRQGISGDAQALDESASFDEWVGVSSANVDNQSPRNDQDNRADISNQVTIDPLPEKSIVESREELQGSDPDSDSNAQRQQEAEEEYQDTGIEKSPINEQSGSSIEADAKNCQQKADFEAANQSPKTPGNCSKFPYRTSFLSSASSGDSQKSTQGRFQSQRKSSKGASDENELAQRLSLQRKMQTMPSIELRSDSPRDLNDLLPSPDQARQVMNHL